MGVNTVYWNYDLKALLDVKVPKGYEQHKRDKDSIAYQDFSDYRLLGEEKCIVDENHIVSDWKLVTTNREFRSQISKFVGEHAHYYKINKEKILIINSEAMKKGDGIIPQQYQRGKHIKTLHKQSGRQTMGG